MQKLALILLLTLGSCTTATSRTMKDVFLALPEALMPILDEGGRLDCIDYIESGMKANVRNRFGTISSLDSISDTYAALTLTAASRMEMALLVSGKDTLLCMIKTYLTPIAESTIAFYRIDDFKPVDAKRLIRQPESLSFVKKGPATKAFKEIEHRIDAAQIETRIDPTTKTLTFVARMDGNDRELRETLTPLLLPQLRYEWNGRKYQPKP